MRTHTRRRLAKGKWMKLINAEILKAHLKHRDMAQARLARYVGCSRQFVYQLINEDKTSCTPELAHAIEDVLNVPRGALFVEKKSIEVVPKVKTSKPRNLHAA
jgi:DNA-binding XRE family transcriptional regulator